MRWIILCLLLAACSSQIDPDENQTYVITGKGALCGCQYEGKYIADKSPDYYIGLAREGIRDFHSGTEKEFSEIKNISIPVTVNIRDKGKLQATGYACSASLEHTIYLAAKDAASHTGLKAGEIEVSIHNNFREGIAERGIDGIIDPASCSFMEGKQIIETNYNMETSIKKICDGCVPKIFSSEVFGESHTIEGSHRFFRGNILENKKVDEESILNSRNAAWTWLMDQFKDGSFRYRYQPSSMIYPENNNMVRQLMASVVLAKSAYDGGEELRNHRANIEFILSNWTQSIDDLTYVFYENKSKLGANAMLLRVFAHSPLIEEFSEEADRIGATVLSHLDDDGSFSAWYIEPGYEYDEDYLLTFYSGEAILALVEYYGATDQQEYLDAAILAQDHYIAQYVDDIDKNYYPAYVPWHSQSLYFLYMITEDTKYLDAIIAMNDKVLELQNLDGQPYPDYLGRFYNPATPEYGSPHVSSDSVYTEGLAFAYQAAKITGDQQKANLYKERIDLALQNLMRLQFSDTGMYYISNPEKVRGGLRTHVANNHLRIDNNQHAIDAMQAILDFGIFTE